MKNPTLFVFSLFLLCAFTSYLPLSTALDQVYDTNGNQLANNGEYYIVPVTGGATPNGIDVLPTGTEESSHTIVQASRGIRFSTVFTSNVEVRPRPRFILQNMAFDIEFGAPYKGQPWIVVSTQPEGLALKLGGYKTTVKGHFRIQKFSAGSTNYKLLFCPKVGQCGNIAVYTDGDGLRRLVVSDSKAALEVQFQKYGTRFAMDNHLQSVAE